MAAMIRIVSVKTGREVSRATLTDTGTVTYRGGASARSAVRRWLAANPGRTEADAIQALAREGWSNGYLMVSGTTDTTPRRR